MRTFVVNCFRSFGTRDGIAYFILICICFFLFQQADLYHTVASSFAYLNGHFKDFYEFNKSRFERNDYLPLLYLIFSAWNFPLYLLGINYDPGTQHFIYLSRYAVFWSKLLVVGFFFLSALVISRIAESIGPSSNRHYIFRLFLSSPIAIFAIFIMGQYDIIGLFFSLLGLLFLLRRNVLLFSICLSVAISFKYFALVAFFPLLLLVEKNLFKVVLYTVIALSLTALQFVLYSGSQAFLSSSLFLASHKIGVASAQSLPIKMMIAGALYSFICLFAFRKSAVDVQVFHFYCVVLPLCAYGVFFGYIEWHPQWLIIVVPFLSLGFLYVQHRAFYYSLDVLLGVSFFVLVVFRWPSNLDATMIYFGIANIFNLQFFARNFDLFNPIFSTFSMYGFYAAYILMVALVLIGGRDKAGNIQAAAGGAFFNLRLLVVLLAFVIPSLIVVVVPSKFVIEHFNAVERFPKSVIIPNSRMPLGEITSNAEVTQTFIAEKDGMFAVSPLLATYARKNSCDVHLAVRDKNGRLIIEKRIDAASIIDNKRYQIYFDPIEKSKGEIFEFSMSSERCFPGNAITAWRSQEDSYSDGELTVGGVSVSGDLDFVVYYRH